MLNKTKQQYNEEEELYFEVIIIVRKRNWENSEHAMRD